MRSSLATDELSAHHALTTLPEVWLDLAHGLISADEAAASMEIEGTEPPELVERSKVLFLPPSAADEERRLEALLQAHFPEPVRRRVPRWVQAGVVALAAAGLVLMIMPTIPRTPAAFDGGYSLELSPGTLAQRDEPVATGGVERYREEQQVRFVLRPRDTVGEAVGAVAFAVAGGEATLLRSAPEVNEHGVVVIAGTPAALGLPPGRVRLVVVVGPPEHLPRAYEGVQDGADAPYDVLTAEVEIVIAPDPPPP
jgi:hypothetical protein